MDFGTEKDRVIYILCVLNHFTIKDIITYWLSIYKDLTFSFSVYSKGIKHYYKVPLYTKINYIYNKFDKGYYICVKRTNYTKIEDNKTDYLMNYIRNKDQLYLIHDFIFRSLKMNII